MFRFSISNAFRRKGVALIAIIGTALGIALMTVLLSLSEGMDKLLTQTMNRVAGDVIISPQDAPLGFFVGGGTGMPISYVGDIEQLEHVKVVSPAVTAFIPKEILDAGDPIGFTLQGVDLGHDAQMEGATVHIIEGRSLQGANDVIVGKTLLQHARLRGLKTLEIGSKFTVRRVVTRETMELTIVGTFETENLATDMTMHSLLATARDVAGLPQDTINSIRVRTDGSEYVEGVAQRIADMFKDTAVPVRPMISKDILGEINRSLNIFQNSLLVVSLAAAVAGGVSIFIIMLMSVIERMREFGIVKAAGWSNLNIVTSVVIESITIALVGAGVGFAIGLGTANYVNRYLAEDIAAITARLVGEVVLFGVIMGVIGGLYPAIRAARVSPMETLRAV